MNSVNSRKKIIFILGILIISLIFTSIILIRYSTFGNECRIERIYYETKDDVKISAIIFRPDPNLYPGKRPAIIYLHDFLESKEFVKKEAILLAKAGFIVFSYDQRGFQNSEGVCHFASLNYEIKDINSAIEILSTLEYVNMKAIGLYGKGYGASLGLIGMASLKNKINASFLVNPYYNLSGTFDVNLNCIQSEILRNIANYLGYIPHMRIRNNLTREQFINIKDYLDYLVQFSALAWIKSIFILDKYYLKFNTSALELRSPSIYLSEIKNDSIFIAVGSEDTVYSPKFSAAIKNKLENEYNINLFYHEFTEGGHTIDTSDFLNALVNFFNLKLYDKNFPDNDYLASPDFGKINDFYFYSLNLENIVNSDDLLFKIITCKINSIPLFFLIIFLIIFILNGYFIILFYKHNEKTIDFKEKPFIPDKNDSKRQRIVKKAEIYEIERIVRDITSKRFLKRKRIIDEKNEEELEKKYIIMMRYLLYILYLFTLSNLFLIPFFGMIFLNDLNIFTMIFIFTINLLISFYIFSKLTDSSNNSIIKNDENTKPNIYISAEGKNKEIFNFHTIIIFLLFFIGIIVIFSIIMKLFKMSEQITTNISENFLYLGILGAIILIFDAGLIIFRAKKTKIKSSILSGFKFHIGKTLRDLGFAIYFIQIPLTIYIIGSYFLVFSSPILSKNISYIYGLPILIIFFLGFDFFIRSIIQNKNEYNKKLNFYNLIIDSIFYMLFLLIVIIISNNILNLGNLMFMNLFWENILSLIIFLLIISLLGSISYYITKTPITSSIINSIIIIFTFIMIS
ncbi:MAG: alpha/beta hydrolase [Promethearchaeota archaeon]